MPDTERPSINGLKLRIPKKYLENQVPEDKEFHANLPKLEMFPTQDHNVENATWGSLPFCLFKEIINKTYDEICHYRRNIFKIPSGKIGKMFIEELTFWLQQFNSSTIFNSVALKVFMILPSLMLQKPSLRSKAKDHADCLRRRLELWRKGDIEFILKKSDIFKAN